MQYFMVVSFIEDAKIGTIEAAKVVEGSTILATIAATITTTAMDIVGMTTTDMVVTMEDEEAAIEKSKFNVIYLHLIQQDTFLHRTLTWKLSSF